MELKFLGKGSAFYPVYGNTGAYMLYGKELYLIDCGETAFDQLYRRIRLDEIEKVYVLEEKLDMNYASRKVPMPKDGERKEPFAVQKHHLDTNHHVNNGQYIQMAREYIPEDFPIRQMRAEYKKSAVLGDMIYPVVQKEDNRYMTALCDELGRPYAVVELS